MHQSRVFACLLAILAFPLSEATGQETGGGQEPALVERPKYQFLRFKEDWSKFGRTR